MALVPHMVCTRSHRLKYIRDELLELLMRTDEIALRVWVGAAAILLSVACGAFGQGKSEAPSKDEAQALLQRAAKVTNLRATDSTPFHLLVKAKSFGEEGEIVEGHYELWWKTSDHWSSRIEWANNAELDVTDNNRIWKQGEDTHLVESRRLWHVLDFSGELKSSAEGKLGKVKPGKLDGQAVVCVQIQWSAPFVSTNLPSGRTLCVESVSGLPLKFDTGVSRLELGEFMAFGEKRFPKTLRLVNRGKTIMEVQVESLAELDPTKLEAFSVPVGAASFPWCSDMVGPWPTRLGDQSPFPLPPPLNSVALPPNSVALPLNMDITKFSVVLFKVGETGAVHNVRAFMPGGEVLLKDKEKTILLKSTFKPATCDSSAIEAEFPMEFHFPFF